MEAIQITIPLINRYVVFYKIVIRVVEKVKPDGNHRHAACH
jgi:hypothetical protein